MSDTESLRKVVELTSPDGLSLYSKDRVFRTLGPEMSVSHSLSGGRSSTGDLRKGPRLSGGVPSSFTKVDRGSGTSETPEEEEVSPKTSDTTRVVLRDEDGGRRNRDLDGGFVSMERSQIVFDDSTETRPDNPNRRTGRIGGSGVGTGPGRRRGRRR